jgi:hypothetical protein
MAFAVRHAVRLAVARAVWVAVWVAVRLWVATARYARGTPCGLAAAKRASSLRAR